MSHKILAINPGSTSTKIALYSGESMVFTKTIDHSPEELNKFNNIADQFDYRKDIILEVLKKGGCELTELSAVVRRGGILPPVESGAYRINKDMVDRLKNNPVVEHASNLGALIANAIAEALEIPGFIYDSVSVDQLEPVARVSGMAGIERSSTFHALNSRAMAIKVAEKLGKKYEDLNFIVAHLGGGISLSAHRKGKAVDIIADDEGPFSPERAGRVPCKKLIDVCYSGDYDKRNMHRKLRGNGGVNSYFGTNDMRVLERMVKDGNQEAVLIYEAMAYQIAKGIGELSAVLCGAVDAIITGGIAHSNDFVSLIEKRISFIAPVEVMPGENEMDGLALGALRVLENKEIAKEYIDR
ncbi:butyrate kinase [Alkaliphilus sp. MSJ-5]|uniref:Probable butyrate kinase n=1 Tax=Alkaliphilus flagellatus TaxID=2841507 RepID=A0ABS6G6W6_9FIRM|nr:butyrate kinase [Alkaliphilus flagellatus]MBU5678233.1 butyrate kinase [Alkaliphilus flagellatus]